MSEESTDVLIVGAGLSGLSAAVTLRRAGATFRVLEASDDVGGRLRSEKAGSVVANLGAEWIGARHRRMHALVRSLGLRLERTGFLGARIRWRTASRDEIGRLPAISNASRLGIARALLQLQRLARGVDPQSPWRSAAAESLDRQDLGSWLRARGVGDDGHQLLDALVGDLVSRTIDELSLLHVVWWVRRNEGPLRALRSAFDARVVEGSEEVARRLAAPLAGRIQADATVAALEQGASGVAAICSDGRSYRARQAILAVPATRLGDFGFDPPLEPGNRRLARELAIGAATKVVGVLRGDTSGLPRVVVGGDVLRNCWRYGATVTGFARPPGDGLGEQRLADELAAAFGVASGELEQIAVRRWAEASRIQGCDVCFMPGQLRDLGPLLRRDHGQIRFAGPERSSWPNNMEGALESGELAARRCLRALG